jgi:hypothetical protein
MNEIGSGEGGFTVDAETWLSDLLPDLSTEDLALLSDLDRDIIFDALVEFAERGSAYVEVHHETPGANMSADAPWLVPGTRIHVRAGESARDAVKRLVRVAAVVAITGSASAGFVGLTADVVLGIFERTSRLDDIDFDIVLALLELQKSRGEAFPSEADLRRLFPSSKDLTARLTSLEERGVIAGGSEGWQVRF